MQEQPDLSTERYSQIAIEADCYGTSSIESATSVGDPQLHSAGQAAHYQFITETAGAMEGCLEAGGCDHLQLVYPRTVFGEPLGGG